MFPFPCFNPLHCGAVVASLGRKETKVFPFPCFNPLHCGAVVASRTATKPARRAGGVSIPFIAGQWSLQNQSGSVSSESYWFQSPSLRGSGRFCSSILERSTTQYLFQSPSLRGSGRFILDLSIRRKIYEYVSIPFIAGQWSLRRLGMDQQQDVVRPFQSPSLRGSGRFVGMTVGSVAGDGSGFQSPSLRGSGRFVPGG